MSEDIHCSRVAFIKVKVDALLDQEKTCLDFVMKVPLCAQFKLDLYITFSSSQLNLTKYHKNSVGMFRKGNSLICKSIFKTTHDDEK